MLRIALPNKGRLADRARELLSQAGLRPRMRGERVLQASLGAGLQGLFVRAQDIPEFVADGAASLGICGLDLVRESGREVDVLSDLEFGACRLVVACRDDAAIDTAADIPPGSKVATTFPRIASSFFESRGVPISLVTVSGATEITPHLGVAQYIVDLVATGSTLRTNGLREVETILESTAVLIGRPNISDNANIGSEVERLTGALDSVVRAKGKRYLMANVRRDSLEQVRRILPGISGPTIVDVLDGGEIVAAHAVVDNDDLYRTVGDLKALGATGILVTPIERLMP